MITEREFTILEGKMEDYDHAVWLSATLLERLNDNTFRTAITTTARLGIGSRLRFGAGNESNACLLSFLDAVVVSTTDVDHIIEFTMTGPVLEEMLERLRRSAV